VGQPNRYKNPFTSLGLEIWAGQVLSISSSLSGSPNSVVPCFSDSGDLPGVASTAIQASSPKVGPDQLEKSFKESQRFRAPASFLSAAMMCGRRRKRRSQWLLCSVLKPLQLLLASIIRPGFVGNPCLGITSGLRVKRQASIRGELRGYVLACATMRRHQRDALHRAQTRFPFTPPCAESLVREHALC
jgi:hypothetical protein